MKKEVVISNFLWRFMEKCGAQIVSFAVSVILARILAPTDYGTVALLNVIINILNVFVTCGFGVALIQKVNADDLDYSSIFYVQLFLCIALYILLFFCAPLISIFYSQQITGMIRVLGLTLIIAGVKNVQTSYISSHMMFKKSFFSTLGGTLVSALVGVTMAYSGFGAWALIFQNISGNLADTVILWITVKWRPRKCFSMARVAALLKFGWKILASNLLDTIYNNLRSLIIGKVYSTDDLAFYNKGESWPALFVENVNSSVDSVLLPAMSSVQNDRESLRNITRRSIRMSSYIMAPLMMGLAFCGVPLIRLVLTDKWLPCVPFQIIFCITYMFRPLHTANLNAIKALGKSDVFLKLEIIKKIFAFSILAVTAPISVKAMAYSFIATSFANQIIHAWPNKKLLGYGYLEQLKDMAPSITIAVFMGACIYPIQFLFQSDLITLIVQFVLGVMIYVIASIAFRLDEFYIILKSGIRLIKGNND